MRENAQTLAETTLENLFSRHDAGARKLQRHKLLVDSKAFALSIDYSGIELRQPDRIVWNRILKSYRSEEQRGNAHLAFGNNAGLVPVILDPWDISLMDGINAVEATESLTRLKAGCLRITQGTATHGLSLIQRYDFGNRPGSPWYFRVWVDAGLLEFFTQSTHEIAV